MKRNYLNEIFDCLLFGILTGFGNCLGHWAGTYIIEKINEKEKKRIGF